MSEFLLGIDVGTTGAKAALFDLNGRLHGLGQAEYPLHHPHPGWAEQDPEDWWRAVCIAVRAALAGHSASRVAGLAVSSQAPTLLALDAAGQPLRPALIWMDRRADAEAGYLADFFGHGEIERITGNRPDAFYVAPKLLWLRQHEPAVFDAARLFVQANGYIAFRMTGRHSLDTVHGGLLQLRDHRRNAWSLPLCQAVGVSPDHFPPILPGHTLLGEVTAAASEACGLRQGTPVMVGAVDGAAAAVEAGAVDDGIAAEMTGTSTVLLMPNAAGIVEPAFIAMPHAIPGLTLLLGAMAASGASLRWFRDQFGVRPEAADDSPGHSANAYDLLTAEAAQVKPGSDGVLFLPYMMGERAPIWHSSARGVFFGLSLSTPRGALVRAILEGAAFGLRHNLEGARQAGVKVSELRSVGGGAASPLWNQIKADVLGIPVLLPQASVGAPFGDAVLVGMGLGLFADPRQVLRDLVRIDARFDPDPDRHALYDQLYPIFRDLYEHLRSDFDHLAAIDGLH